MKSVFRWFTIFLVALVALAFVFYTIGFTMQLIGFSEAVSREGLREALSPAGSDIEFYAGTAGLAVMIIGTYAIPAVLLILAIRYFRKKKNNK